MDVAALVDAGLYDPNAANATDRLALLEFLAVEGLTVDEMVAAHERGRLFALAGDRYIRPLDRRLTLDEIAALFQIERDDVGRMWRSLGFADPGDGVGVLTHDEAMALAFLPASAQFIGADVTMQLTRVLGVSIARIAEAIGATMARLDGMNTATSGSELVTARTFAGAASLIPQMNEAIRVIHSLYTESTIRHFEAAASLDESSAGTNVLRLTVGFADLTGFTATAEGLSPEGLSAIVTTFEEQAFDVITAEGGRLVKFIGDEVMFVTSAPRAAAAIAHELVRRFDGNLLPRLRAGLGYGPIVPQDGDYFGPVVNRAARLVDQAQPGEVLCDAELAGVLDPNESEPAGVRELKGLGPTATFRLASR